MRGCLVHVRVSKLKQNISNIASRTVLFWENDDDNWQFFFRVEYFFDSFSDVVNQDWSSSPPLKFMDSQYWRDPSMMRWSECDDVTDYRLLRQVQCIKVISTYSIKGACVRSYSLRTVITINGEVHTVNLIFDFLSLSTKKKNASDVDFQRFTCYARRNPVDIKRLSVVLHDLRREKNDP